MWLWVDSIYELGYVTQPDKSLHTVVVRTVADTAAWSLDGTPVPNLNCGQAPTQPSQGGGTPYDPAYDPTNATAVPQACIYGVSSSAYYSVNGSTTSDGVHTFTAAVTWHVDFEIINTATGATITPWTLTVPSAPAANSAASSIPFRVGEIQALAIGPQP